MHDQPIPSTGLWRDRAFVLFWLARITSITGSTITAVVLPLLVFQLTDSALQTALLASLQVVPYFVFGLLAGALADRVNRRRMMVVCDILNAALLASIPLAAAVDLLTLPHIYAVALLSASAFVWFDAANFGALPMLVGRERIVAANSAIWSASTVVSIVGPALGAALATMIGAANVLSLDALSYVISAILLLLVPRALNAATTPDQAAGAVLGRIVPDIRAGLHFLWNHRLVRTMTLLGFGNSLTGGAVVGLLVVYAVRGLGLAQNDVRIGWLFTAGAIGALVVSLILPRLTAWMPVGRITLIGMWASVGLLVGLALTPMFWAALAAYALWEATYTLVIINAISLRQIVTPDDLQSRVNTAARMIAWGGQPFGAAAGGVLAELLPVRTALLLMIIPLALCAILGWFSPLRTDMPENEQGLEPEIA